MLFFSEFLKKLILIFNFKYELLGKIYYHQFIYLFDKKLWREVKEFRMEHILSSDPSINSADPQFKIIV